MAETPRCTSGLGHDFVNTRDCKFCGVPVPPEIKAEWDRIRRSEAQDTAVSSGLREAAQLLVDHFDGPEPKHGLWTTLKADVATIRAALAHSTPEPVTETPDVAVLEWAMQTVAANLVVETLVPLDAERIAAEYARLTAHKEEHGG